MTRSTRALLLAGGALLLTTGANAAGPLDLTGLGNLGTLVVSSSTYAGTAATIAVGQTLPNSARPAAVADGSYPGVFANDSVDGNFGIASPLLLTALTTEDAGRNGIRVTDRIGTLNVTSRLGVATSFASKSEIALNLSADNRTLTFMGYAAAVNALDVSNSDTPNHPDPTNTDTAAPTSRVVVQLDLGARLQATPVNAYSGNNGRAAVLARNLNGSAAEEYLMVGSAGNGSGVEPASINSDTGVQLIAPLSPSAETTVVGVEQGMAGAKNGHQYGFSIASLGQPADKSGKDDNFRGLTVYRNQLYVTKGSGGNGVNTVYQVSPPGGGLPTAASAAASTITILPGLPVVPAAYLGFVLPPFEFYPFGIFFASPTVMYVSDEGAQSLLADPNAGLQKWIFDGSRWHLAYILQAGLALGQSYQVSGYPAADAPATTGLRNLTGNVTNGVVTLFATTATFSALADPGADPNQVVRIVDQLAATSLPTTQFTTVLPPRAGTVYRGVAFVRCTEARACEAPFSVAR